MFDLSGLTAFVTGAGQGVGAAIARALATQGAAVAVNDINDRRADEISEALRAGGCQAITAVADVTSPEQVSSALGLVGAAFGPVDILVNNAGVPSAGFHTSQFALSEPSEWDSWLDLNLRAVMICTRLALPSMIASRWGRVITIVSDAGRAGEPGTAVYSGAKGGASAFSRSLAKEVGPDGVTCNCLSLGNIETNLVPGDPTYQRRAAKYPVRRLGRPEDVAPAVTWLASSEAEWITGQTISINGGYAMF